MKTKQFKLLYVMNFFSVFLGYFITNEYKVYWFTANDPPSDHFIAIVGSIGSIFNGLRFVWSAALDYYPYKVVYGTMLTI